MTLITSALIALALAAPATVKSVFTPLVSFENYVLSINSDSVKIFGPSESPIVLLDMRMDLTEVLDHPELPKPIKAYVNTVAVDCKADVLHVIVSRAFGVSEDLLHTSAEPSSILNPHDLGTPVSVIMNFACTPIEKIEKEKKLKPAKNYTITS